MTSDLPKLNAKRGPESKLAAPLAQPLGEWWRIALTNVGCIHRRPRILNRTVRFNGHSGDIRQIAITDLGHEHPRLLITNQMKAPAAQLIVVALLPTEAGMGARAWLRMLFAVLVGAVPMAALGVAVGYWANPKAALPIANLLYILLAFLGGIFPRPELMQDLLDRISLMTPVRHICELTWASALGVPWSSASFLWLSA